MSIRALPLLVVPLIIYNIVAVFAGGGPATGPLSATLFTLPMPSGAEWTFAWGDLVLLITLVVLFAELVKATYTSTISLISIHSPASARKGPGRPPGSIPARRIDPPCRASPDQPSLQRIMMPHPYTS